MVTSSRSSRRRISNFDAAKAFAVATSGFSEKPNEISALKSNNDFSKIPFDIPVSHKKDRTYSAGAGK